MHTFKETATHSHPAWRRQLNGLVRMAVSLIRGVEIKVVQQQAEEEQAGTADTSTGTGMAPWSQPDLAQGTAAASAATAAAVAGVLSGLQPETQASGAGAAPEASSAAGTGMPAGQGLSQGPGAGTVAYGAPATGAGGAAVRYSAPTGTLEFAVFSVSLKQSSMVPHQPVPSP